MASRGVRRSRSEEEEESYFISMADMMVGLLFVFIILLLYFALQFRQTTVALDATPTRELILKTLEKQLKDRGLKVTIDTDTGVLRLPEDVLFDKGQAVLTPQGRAAVAIVATEMAKVLPCYTFGVPRPADCPSSPHRIDALFVEGHTDKDPMAGAKDNLDLSVERATNTYRALKAAAPLLTEMRNLPPGEGEPLPILSVSGYGPDRPLDPGDNDAAKAKNRRIDLRFLMVTPRAPESLTGMLTQ